ncbi:MAG: tyrosine-type recombinase/integrase, partial [Bacteroidota bacterium]
KKILLNSETYRQLAHDYRHYLATVGYRNTTVTEKHRQLVKFLCWSEDQQLLQIDHIHAHHLERYKTHLQAQPNQNTGGKLSGKTIYDKLRALALFFMMLQRKGQILLNPFSTFKNTYQETTAERTLLTQSEIRQLYGATINDQERAILSLAYGCGLRAAELEAVNVQDIKLRAGILIVPKGKGHQRRAIPLSPGVKEDLKNYYHAERRQLPPGSFSAPRKVSQSHPEQAFMLNRNGDRMRTYTWNKHVKQIIERSDHIVIQSKGISLHSLRHSIATHLLENGLRVEEVQLFLGHRQLETTEIYTRVSHAALVKLNTFPQPHNPLPCV